MNFNFRWLGLAGLVAALAVGTGCAGEDPDTAPPPGPCDNVECGDNMVCSETDGQCHCGDAGGPICSTGFACVVDPTGENAASCRSELCDLVQCTGGQSCDPSDGQCKCGTTSCEEGQQCIQGVCTTENPCDSITCGLGLACDPDDGLCKCGDSVCSVGERCEASICVEDTCAGVNCGPNTECNPEDGLCHCGTADGDICTSGQACEASGAAYVCTGPGLCDDAAQRCLGGTTCDPDDGSCRCGGVGATNPECGAGQTCVDGQCLGGDKCTVPSTGLPVECGSGTSCDPEDGLCKCGGIGGLVCDTGDICVDIGGVATCTDPCDPGDATSSCADGYACYYDASQRDVGPFCSPEGEVGPGGTCEHAADCQEGNHCWLNSESSRCRSYCDTDSDEIQCDIENNEYCVPVGGAPDGIGVCLRVG